MKDLFLLDESEESEVYRAIPAWLPDNWQLQGDRRTGLGAFRLAVLWHAALEEAIKAWLQVTGAPGMAFDIGWGFMNERSEEHTSELQSLMRISYAVFCLKKKTNHKRKHTKHEINNHNNTNLQ